MNKTRIAIIRKDTGLFGGIQHQVLMLASGLLKNNYSVYFFTDNIESELAQELILKGVKVNKVTLGRVFSSGKKVSELCKKHNIRVLQSHMLKESFIARVSKIFNKDVIHIFRVHTYIDCSHIPQWKKNTYHFLSKITDFLVDHYLSINEYNVKELIDRTRINNNKISVVYNGIVSSDVEINKISKPIEKIAMIANFRPFKGHDILIKTLKKLKDQGVILKVVIVGGESYSKGLNQTPVITHKMLALAEQLGVEDQIILTGFISNVHERIKDIPIVVLPSYSEGTPNCLLEAMSLKKIVIASSVGGVPEFIIDGKNGFLHISKSVDAFAEVLKKVVVRLSESELNSIAEHAYSTWLYDYSEDVVIKKYVDFLNKRYVISDQVINGI